MDVRLPLHDGEPDLPDDNSMDAEGMREEQWLVPSPSRLMRTAT
ncbi:hypothetical protein STRAU_0988 [Streptomyces aurantiacus JA 4570]|uniref:Uncharacterized protein n=2 Tax=Streptomyces aurantiacus TaxID=47760 RepID=S3ZRB9_9ACTN|nr:hypothetical protein STRAU_0988 [Streptomyces aurantiacus JA 4570]